MFTRRPFPSDVLQYHLIFVVLSHLLQYKHTCVPSGCTVRLQQRAHSEVAGKVAVRLQQRAHIEVAAEGAH